MQQLLGHFIWCCSFSSFSPRYDYIAQKRIAEDLVQKLQSEAEMEAEMEAETEAEPEPEEKDVQTTDSAESKLYSQPF